MIQIDHISYAYKKTEVLKNVTFDIPKKSIFGLLGKNGAGKSTLIKIILGIIIPDSGTVKINQQLINQFNRLLLSQKIGSLIENASLYDFLSPIENLELARRIYGTEKEYLKKLLSVVGLENVSQDKVSTFSLGMRQRLGIALAMIGKPEIVILDEPTNGLDPNGLNEFRELILKLNKENDTTFLISSHHLSELEKIATHVGIIHNGTSVHTSELKGTSAGTLDKIYFDLVKG
jgi:ABC-2 type transport system ATP-binding protein